MSVSSSAAAVTPGSGVVMGGSACCRATPFTAPAIWTLHKSICAAFSTGTVSPTYPASAASTFATAKPTSVLSPSIRCSGELA